MKVIVCGAGQVGFNIAKHLADQNNDVTVIDRSSALIRQISERLDVQALVGFASDPALLERAGAADADLLVAVTLSDEVNMIACQVAYSLFRVPTKIARVRNQAYLDEKWGDLFSRGNLPVDVVISPELEIAKALQRRLEVPGAFNMMPFENGRVRVIGLHLDENCPVLDAPLRQLTELFPNLKTTVIGVVRSNRVFVPRSADALVAGDSIYIAVDASVTDRALAVFGYEEQRAQRIAIVGGGNIGTFLAERLETMEPRPKVRLIEINRERALKISERLPETVVINGDALERDILAEASIAETDVVVTVADDDEVNILASILAKKEGCGRAISLVNNAVYGALVGELGIDVALDPRETTVSGIVRHIRRGRILELFSLREGQAEVIEAEVIEGSEVAGAALKDLKLHGDVRFGLIIRGDEILVPTADMRLEAGDHVVMLALEDFVGKIEKMFSVRAGIF